MIYLPREQRNAARSSFATGHWIQGVRISAEPLRTRLSRLKKLAYPRRRGGESAAPIPAPPSFSHQIQPLFVAKLGSVDSTFEFGNLYREVDEQIQGTFRLAGGAYRQVEFSDREQFAEPEDSHARERLYWVSRYAQAAAFGHTGAMAGLRRDWNKWASLAKGSIAFAPYTVAERIASLSDCLFWINECANAGSFAEVLAMKQQVWSDAHRLSHNIEYALGAHNHLLNDARALYRASRVLCDVDEAAIWREQAFQLWEEFFPKMLLDDGTFAEQSSHYHLLLCRTALEYFLGARISDRPLSPASEELFRRMFRVANDLLRVDGSLPRFGHISPDHVVEDLWGLLAAAHHHGLLETCPRHIAITPLTFLYCGPIPPPEPALPSNNRFYRDGGFMFLQSADEALEVAVHADPRSETQAHGTPARGSFELRWGADVLVRAPGSVLSSSDSSSARSCDGLHENTTCLDGLASAVSRNDRKCLPAGYGGEGGAWTVVSESGLTFRWDGFRRIRRDIVLHKRWRFESPNRLCIEERIEGSTAVQFQSRLYLGDGDWQFDRHHSGNSVELRWTRTDDSFVLVQVRLPQGVSAGLTSGSYFPEFGVERRATVLALAGRVTLPTQWITDWHFSASCVRQLSEVKQQCAG